MYNVHSMQSEQINEIWMTSIGDKVRTRVADPVSEFKEFLLR